MNTPNSRDVERMLQSMADQEPPEGLLERLEATVPEEIPTPEVVPFEPRVQKWNRNRLVAAALGLAAVIAIGVATAPFLQDPGRAVSTGSTVMGQAQQGAGTGARNAEASATGATHRATPVLPRVSGTGQQPAAEFGAVAGRATDGREALPGVKVTVTAHGTGKSWSAVTSAEGDYRFLRLPTGGYVVKFELAGFQTVDTRVRVAGRAATRVDAQMGVASFAEAISVAGESLSVRAWSAACASTIETGPARIDGFDVPGVGGAELVVIQSETGLAGDGNANDSDDPEEEHAALQVRDQDGEAAGDLPLKHTSVKADIAGFMARTVVTQEYVNTFAEPIEAVYVFPLGAMAAVNDFVMEVGERRIVGVVRPREEAERIYQQARERGQTASLLTQERPNVFTQNVANIAPGGTVKITITTFETLPHDRGTFEYVFPMVVGPRYIPGAPLAATPAAVGGGGWSAPTTVVPDADRITPPVLEPGQRSGHDVDLEVRLDAGLPITEVRSVVHPVTVTEDGPSRRTITLASGAAIPNRDFVLRWKVAGEKLQTGILTYRDRDAGYLALLVQPPLDPEDALVAAREITFVLDVSGSMSGVPIETSKNLVRRVLDGLRPADAFNIFVFAGSNGQLWEEPRGSSPENVAEAKRFLTSLQGSGGTEMLAGLRRAIAGAHDPARLQMYVFCTDGFVGDEERILAFVQQERGEARFFAFGIGSSVNRYLIDGIGRLGGGTSMVVLPRELGAAERVADRFFSMIDAPVLVDARIDWNGLPVADAYPSRLGDLFTGGAFNLVARYTHRASGTAYLTGRLGTRTVRFPIKVRLPRQGTDHPELAPVWARHRIADLSVQMLTADAARAAELRKAITELAIEYRLASPFTSFVAVDESEVHGDGKPKRVNQKVPMPQDVRHEGVFGPRK